MTNSDSGEKQRVEGKESGKTMEDVALPLTGEAVALTEKNFYVTTPIYYPNAVPHIGHAYTTIVADICNRYNRFFGKETFFVTGTDEHGQKVQEAAEGRGMSPQAHVDEISEQFSGVWREFSVLPDLFMRTTFDFHKRFVQECLQQLWDTGDIYKGNHTGWYSVSEEIFWPAKDIVDGKSPTGKEVVEVSEENYFFRMSKYQQRLVEYIENHSDFILPPEKASETLGFLRKNLEDLCIGRPKSRVSWGIELPFDTDYVAYVWFDALLNYLSAIDHGNVQDSKTFTQFWPSVRHLIGKDILITHTVYFPTMLMALDIALPKTIFAHGWWLNSEGRKMSKSEGEVVAPLNMKSIFGEDPFRYYMARGLRFGNDLAFDIEKAKAKLNEELANNFGNLVSRSVKLAAKTFDGHAPKPSLKLSASRELAELALAVPKRLLDRIEQLDIEGGVGEVVQLLDSTNKYFNEHAPWKLVKEGALDEAGEILYSSLEAARIAAILLIPVMPKTCKAILAVLGSSEAEMNLDAALTWGLINQDVALDASLSPMFSRL